MDISIERVEGAVPVTILSTHGELDASNYQDLIAKAREVYSSGSHNILLDLSDTPFISSSGLVALHSIATLVRGKTPPDPESGWEALHALDRDRGSGMQHNVKLLNPQARVDRALEMTGLKQFFEIYSDRETAIASFT